MGVIGSIAFGLLNRVVRMGRRGQSLGKSALGIVLLDARTGRPVGATACFGRELVSGLVNQVVYLSSLWMLWDDQKQTLHDKVVGSTVVHVRR